MPYVSSGHAMQGVSMVRVTTCIQILNCILSSSCHSSRTRHSALEPASQYKHCSTPHMVTNVLLISIGAPNMTPGSFFLSCFSPPKQIQGLFPHHSPFTRAGVYETREPQYIARTPVSYFDQLGRLEKGSPKPPSSNDDDFAVITATARGAHGVPSSWFTPPSNSGITSLATTCLKVALRRGHTKGLFGEDLLDELYDKHALIPFAEKLLEQADSNDCGGYGHFKKCHMCETEYLVARAEWIEWWYIHAAEILPFKLQVCSWRCVPDAMVQRPTTEFTWD